jgi:hypothetical protein
MTATIQPATPEQLPFDEAVRYLQSQLAGKLNSRLISRWDRLARQFGLPSNVVARITQQYPGEPIEAMIDLFLENPSVNLPRFTEVLRNGGENASLDLIKKSPVAWLFGLAPPPAGATMSPVPRANPNPTPMAIQPTGQLNSAESQLQQLAIQLSDRLRSRWERIARMSGVSESDIARIGATLPGDEIIGVIDALYHDPRGNRLANFIDVLRRNGEIAALDLIGRNPAAPLFR